MIPRAARRLTARQCLPRPARLYSTPTKIINAPATSTAQTQLHDIPSFMSQNPSQVRTLPLSQELNSFLNRKSPYTIVPTPLPDDRSSDVNDLWFTDSQTQDLVAVMDACLHNNYDVARADTIFKGLRRKPDNPVLETRIYNAFLEAYLDMAASDEPETRSFWVESAWDLFTEMENGGEKIAPNSASLATMLLLWQRYHSNPHTAVQVRHTLTPRQLLLRIVDREIPVLDVVSNRVFTSSDEAMQIIQALSKSAVDLNLSRIVSELGQAEAVGSSYPDALDDVPEAMPVFRAKKPLSDEGVAEGLEAENAGLTPEYEIPFNLDTLRRHLAQVTLARRVLPSDVASRQKLLEESVYDVAVERLKHQADLFAELGLGHHALMQADLQRWMWQWHTKLKDRLEEEVNAIARTEERRKTRPSHMLSPYLLLVKPERLSLITILEIMRLQGSGGLHDGMKTTRALVTLGKAVELEYKAQMCRQHNITVPTSSRPGDTGFFTNLGYKNLQERRVAAAKYMMDGEAWTAVWTQAVRSKIGGILVECLMDVAEVTRTAVDKTTGETISEQQPAFFHSYEYLRGQKLGVIRLNPVVVDRMAKDGLRETLHPRHLPMLMKPKPWLNHDQGGYLYNKTSAMRYKDSMEQQIYLKRASELGNVELVYAGLDVLGSTAWQINKDVFDVVLEVWNSGERLGKLPPAVYDQPEPVPADDYETDLRARSVYMQRMKAYTHGKANNHSERCSVNYKIEIARAFLGDTIYLPHNLDFRGRAYPIPPHLNHIGNDLSRGLLKFGDSKALGVRGLRWLKIHLANLYGFDKANFDERVQFVDDRLADIYDSATNPLKGNRWWAKAEDPWQCLATCMELHAALESGDPYTFMSSLPVHQDGTCNGLQHYAALGGDDQGARQVNLSAGARPSDVYTYVGNMVEQQIDLDLEKGNRYAALLKGKVARKVVKQTVMTTVYGVTFVGARDQIERQLKDRMDIPEEECWEAAAYLAKKTLGCIGDLFSGATAIQSWLNLCARLIAKSIPEERIADAMNNPYTKRRVPKGSKVTQRSTHTRLKKEQMTSVIWTTPLGLPIVQPYRKSARKQIMTSLQTVFISDPCSPHEVNSQKQASAFPPNFIHSLDATHMMLTALECQTQGLSFASVHDSYWTHAASIDKMSEIIRDTFIALHSSDVLGKLRDEFMERYKGYKIPLYLLRQGQLAKQLRKAGSKIVATPEQARSLTGLHDLVEVSDTQASSIDEAPLSDETREAVMAAAAAANAAALAGKKKEKGSVKSSAQELVDMLKSEDGDVDGDEGEGRSAEDVRKDLEKELKMEMEAIEREMGVDQATDDAAAEAEEEEEEDEEAEEFMSNRAKAAKKRKAEDDKVALELMGKFVNLTDILPPLPEKGNFKVETIKRSLYFFS